MEKGLTLEKITKGLVAAEKIRDMLGKNLREEGEAAVKQDNLATVHDTFELLSEFVPAMRGGAFADALQQSSSYSKTYREIKRHVRETGRSKADLSKVAKSIRLVAPVLGNRQKLYFDKIIKIMDILKD